MADHTPIEWTDATWNPVRGCSRVSEGCQHCYAERVAQRFCGPGQPYAGLVHGRTKGWNGKVRLVTEALAWPLKKRSPRRVFVNSMSDLFHEAVPDDFIAAVFGIMAAAPQHTFQILTKRPARMRAWFARAGADPGAWLHEAVKGQMGYDNPRRPAVNLRQWPLPNVWLGISVENQATADERIPLLLQTPAAVRWVSAEPLLGATNLRWFLRRNLWIDGVPVAGADYGHGTRLDWVVAGGESGRGARPMHPDWARSLRDQCKTAGVPFLFKQWGNFAPGKQTVCGINDCYESGIRGGWVELDGIYSLGEAAEPMRATAAHVFEVGKTKAGRMLDGEFHDDYPRPMA